MNTSNIEKIVCLKKLKLWTHFGWWILWLLLFPPVLILMLGYNFLKPHYYQCKVSMKNGDVEIVTYDDEEWEVIVASVDDVRMM